MKGIPAIIAGACAGATEITVTYPFECEHCYPLINIQHVLIETWYLWSSFELQLLRLDPNWVIKSLGALAHMPKSGLVCTMAIRPRYLDQW